jgi:DMSO reductase family type II enzyme chaperone
MMETYRLELKNPPEIQAGSRSLLYSLLAKGFRFPAPEHYESAKSGEFADEVQGAVANLPYNGLPVGAFGRGDGAGYDEFQSNYIGLFEIGGKHGVPSFLYEAEYGGGRMKVMEEVLRFYHYFGLRISEEKRDRPDHLASELEFMHMLTFKEAEALIQGKEKSAYLDAERDFLRFHLCEFVSAIAGRIGGNGVAFYADLARLAEAFCQKEMSYLAALRGGEPNG